MYVNGVLSDNLCQEGSPWCSAGFNRSIWRYDNGTVETSINGFVDEFTAAHNETYIECTSYKYNGSVSEWISLRPDNSTDNNTGKFLPLIMGLAGWGQITRCYGHGQCLFSPYKISHKKLSVKPY